MDVFSTCKLFYPLYSIADEDAIELDQSYTSKQFFNHFYGGPYSIRHSTSRRLFSFSLIPKPSFQLASLADQDLSGMLKDMLNVSSESGAMTQTIDNSSLQQSPDQTVSSGEIVEHTDQPHEQMMVTSDEGDSKKRASSI